MEGTSLDWFERMMLGACVEKKLNKGLFGSEQSVEIILSNKAGWYVLARVHVG